MLTHLLLLKFLSLQRGLQNRFFLLPVIALWQHSQFLSIYYILINKSYVSKNLNKLSFFSKRCMELNVRERDKSGKYIKVPKSHQGSCIRCQSKFTEKSPLRSRGMCGTCYNKVRWLESFGNCCIICKQSWSDDVVHKRMGRCVGCNEILSSRPLTSVCTECSVIMTRKTRIGLCPPCKKNKSTRPKKVTAVLNDEQRSLLRILFVRYKRSMNTLVDNFRVADIYADLFIVSDSFFTDTNTYKDVHQIEVMLKTLKKLYDGQYS